MRITSVHEVVDTFLMKLQENPAGLVVRSVDSSDRKRVPYFWVREANEVDVIVAAVLQSRSQYLMAFAPQTIPKKAKGFVVGRYILGQGATCTLEFIQDAITPRSLERTSLGSDNYGLAKKKCSVFKTIKTPPHGKHLCGTIIKSFLPYEESLSRLKIDVVGERPTSRLNFCVEFTLRRNILEIHDFDYGLIW